MPSDINSLHGWFNFQDIYAQAAREAPPDGILVEIGVAFGRSAAFLVQQLLTLQKDTVAFYAIDPWSECVPHGSAEADKAETARLAVEGGPFNMFMCGMRQFARDELERMRVLRLTSVQAAKLFSPNSIDFCFIDGSHLYDDAKKDIETFLPLIKNGGVLAGHDYDQDGVRRAVHETIGPVPMRGNSWWIRL